MGGASIFRLKKDDPNVGVIIETLTEHGAPFLYGSSIQKLLMVINVFW